MKFSKKLMFFFFLFYLFFNNSLFANNIGVTSSMVNNSQSQLSYNSVQKQIGLPQLLALNPSLTGTGITVAQVEAPLPGGDYFEPQINLNAQFFFINGSGTVTTTVNSNEISGHATNVADIFYSIIPNVNQIYVYDANDSYLEMANGKLLTPNSQSGTTLYSSIQSEVINQSFVFPGENSYGITYLDQLYDNYAVTNNTLFVTAIGDGGPLYATGTTPVSYVNPPADCYNGIGVAALNGGSGVGPTYDGRSKPDITAPGTYTSYTCPVVSGAAALLVQAAGNNTSAKDIRTIKALLLNGAIKPSGWTNNYTVNNSVYSYNSETLFTTTPLDPRYGSGIVNIYNSYLTLISGQKSYSSVITQSTGWDFNTVTTSNNYKFNNSTKTNLTATLVWNIDLNQIKINNLYLELYNNSNQLIASSESTIDNVQQININNLYSGQYSIDVVFVGVISNSEQYSLAWNFNNAIEPSSVMFVFIGLFLIIFVKKYINNF